MPAYKRNNYDKTIIWRSVPASLDVFVKISQHMHRLLSLKAPANLSSNETAFFHDLSLSFFLSLTLFLSLLLPTCLRRRPHSFTTLSSSALIRSELDTRALLFSSRSCNIFFNPYLCKDLSMLLWLISFTCLCKSLLLLQFWAYPRFFKVLKIYGQEDKEAEVSQPSLLLELDDLLPGHPVQPLVELPHTEVDQLLGGAEAVKDGWYLATCWLLMIVDSSPRMASSAPGSPTWLSSGYCMKIKVEISTSPNSSPSAG